MRLQSISRLCTDGICRSDAAWRLLFKRAGLTVIKDEVQHGLPEGLLEVKS